MKVIIKCAVALFMLTDCASKKEPVNNSDFEEAHTLADLQGIYRNKGDAGNVDHDIYLSKIIWPGEEVLDHAYIDLIHVKILNSAKLMITARNGGTTIKEGQFILGKDFSFEKGRILLNREGGVAGFKTGEPLVGFYSGKVMLGLDKKGQGKFRSSSSAVGMAYLIVPVAVKAMEDVRFERIEKDSYNQLKQ